MSAKDSTGDSVHSDPTQPASPAAASKYYRDTTDWDATDPAHPVRKLNSDRQRSDIVARTKFTLPPLPSSTPLYQRPTAPVKPRSSTRPLPEDASIQSAAAPVIGQYNSQQSTPAGPGSTPITPPTPTPAIKFMFPSAPGTSVASGPLALNDQPLPHIPASPLRKPQKSDNHMRKPLIFALIALAVILLLTILFVVASNMIVWPGNSSSVSPLLHDTAPKITYVGAGGHPGAAGGIRSFQIGSHPLVVINGHKGDINIYTGGNGSVQVNARTHGGNSAPGSANSMIQYVQSKDQRGQDRLTITAPSGNANIDFDVTMPTAAQVQIQVDGGSITVNGISAVTIDTFSSSLNVENIRGPVDVQTENGDITARALNGEVKMQTQNGSIRVDTINGQLQALTHNGDVVVRRAALKGQSILETSNGSVRVDGSLDPAGTYRLKTMRGDINLSLPANSAFQLLAHTASGSVSNDFGAGIVGATPRPPLNLTIGDGGSISVSQAAA